MPISEFTKLIEITTGLRRGQVITPARDRLTMVLEGMACTVDRKEDGHRQILAFHYPGDFLGLHGSLYETPKEHIEAEALSDCVVGSIAGEILEHAISHRPELGRVLWRAAMVEASIVRQWLLMARWPAQRRVAHLVCEQLHRLGPETNILPLSQVEVADAVGLSTVHTNRVFQELRGLGLLSDTRGIEVVDKRRLRELAGFSARYLNPNEFLSRWDLRIE